MNVFALSSEISFIDNNIIVQIYSFFIINE